jgi:hypothetical protein
MAAAASAPHAPQPAAILEAAEEEELESPSPRPAAGSAKLAAENAELRAALAAANEQIQALQMEVLELTGNNGELEDELARLRQVGEDDSRPLLNITRIGLLATLTCRRDAGAGRGCTATAAAAR